MRACMATRFTSPRLRGEVDRRRASAGGRVRGVAASLSASESPLTASLAKRSLGALSPQSGRGRIHPR